MGNGVDNTQSKPLGADDRARHVVPLAKGLLTQPALPTLALSLHGAVSLSEVLQAYDIDVEVIDALLFSPLGS